MGAYRIVQDRIALCVQRPEFHNVALLGNATLLGNELSLQQIVLLSNATFLGILTHSLQSQPIVTNTNHEDLAVNSVQRKAERVGEDS